jgi:hypothetical protein
MKIEARHIKGILLKAADSWSIQSLVTGQSDIWGLSEYIANVLNKDLVVKENIAALKSTGADSEKILLKGVTALEEEHIATVNHVDQAIAHQVGMCKHTIWDGPTCMDPIVTCAICGCILDKEMCGEN